MRRINPDLSRLTWATNARNIPAPHARGNPRAALVLAACIVAACVVAACGGRPPAAATPEPTASLAGRVFPLGQVYLLGVSDSATPVPDTTLEVPRDTLRYVVLRHAPPGDLTYAEVFFPANAFGPGPGDSVRVTLHPRPDSYVLDVATAQPFDSARVTFKYAVNFEAPPGALARYGSAVAFERTLAIGRLLPDSSIAFLASTRPAADNLSATITEPGSYAIGAPR
ncbi:MAG TPA: hypothetical protein VFW66_13565 [Gemmatimonadales bacterium]|nr:hypothetical protein [Gemmatimonadales bacterium]